MEIQNKLEHRSHKSGEFGKERKIRMMNTEDNKSKDQPLEGNGVDDLGLWTSRLAQNIDQDNEGSLASLFLLHHNEGTGRWKMKVPLRASQEKKPCWLIDLGRRSWK